MENNQNLDALLNWFERIEALTQDEKDAVAELFQFRIYKPKQYVLQAGSVCKYFNFVVSGCLRMYQIDEKGDVHITQFIAENQWLTDFESYNYQKVSEFYIDALEETKVFQISHDNLLALYQKHPKFERMFFSLVESCYTSLQKRLLSTMSKNADENYASFLQVYSHLADRLP